MRAGVTLALTLGLSAGCAGIETGNPIQPTIDRNKVALEEVGGGQLQLTGEPATVEPPVARLRFIDLEASGGFFDVPVADDGSFDFTFTGEVGHLFRGEATLGLERSNPVDVRVMAFLVPRPCLFVERSDLVVELGPLEVGASEDVRFLASNACDDPLTIDATLRLGTGGYTLTSPNLVLPGGGDGVIEVRVEPNSPGLSEEILVLSADSGEVRAFSFRTQGA